MKYALNEFGLLPAPIMDRQITHPTKEQVRAYMARRESARRPPPSPAEIRRQLGWQLTPANDDSVLLQFCLLPSAYSQLTAQVLFNWLCASSGALRASRACLASRSYLAPRACLVSRSSK